MPSIAQLTSLLLAASGALALPSGLKARAGPSPGTVITSCTEPGTIALTFDDGPYTYMSTILDALAQANASATFFVTGTLYDCIYNNADTLKAAYDAGHQIASHTWTHADLATLSESDINNEMAQLETAFANILGVKPTYMRPPNGSTGGSATTALGALGYRLVTWDIDSQDWNGADAGTSQGYFEQAGTSASHIALMHETIQSTAEQLVPWVLEWATTNGLKMVTVAECVGDAGGEYTDPAASDGSTTC
ncbi:hypothetical protein FQN54_009259 [Arachnomyces sp. PD_36]|nr:hypothetical protein FQN54_009259 [Arachnomyces sp. PD_36]